MKSSFRKFLDGWKKFAHRLGRIQTVILITLFYFLILAPFGGLFRLFGWDPLKSRGFRSTTPSNWTDSNPKSGDLESLKRQS
ncbi:MAG: hypothetical protein ACREBV_07950 [Candidatus Zixiibacteriota bacterium]